MSIEISRTYERWLSLLTFLRSPFLLAIRLIWGGLFVYQGYAKFSDIPSNAEYFSSLGFSPPVAMVYLSATAELGGGALLAVLFGVDRFRHEAAGGVARGRRDFGFEKGRSIGALEPGGRRSDGRSR